MFGLIDYVRMLAHPSTINWLYMKSTLFYTELLFLDVFQNYNESLLYEAGISKRG